MTGKPCFFAKVQHIMCIQLYNLSWPSQTPPVLMCFFTEMHCIYTSICRQCSPAATSYILSYMKGLKKYGSLACTILRSTFTQKYLRALKNWMQKESKILHITHIINKLILMKWARHFLNSQQVFLNYIRCHFSQLL